MTVLSILNSCIDFTFITTGQRWHFVMLLSICFNIKRYICKSFVLLPTKGGALPSTLNLQFRPDSPISLVCSKLSERISLQPTFQHPLYFSSKEDVVGDCRASFSSKFLFHVHFQGWIATFPVFWQLPNFTVSSHNCANGSSHWAFSHFVFYWWSFEIFNFSIKSSYLPSCLPGVPVLEFTDECGTVNM